MGVSCECGGKYITMMGKFIKARSLFMVMADMSLQALIATGTIVVYMVHNGDVSCAPEAGTEQVRKSVR